MVYPEDKSSTIDRVIQSMERTHQLKKEEFREKKAQQNIFSGSPFFYQPVDSLSTPFAQIRSVLGESEQLRRFIFEKIQQEIKQDPWALLGKLAIGSFGLGLILARRLTPRKKVKE